MRMGEIMGRVTLHRQHASVPAGRLLIARPLTRAALLENAPERGEELVIFDLLGAGLGARVGFSEGREAANPFGKTKVPVDAYCACLIDEIHVEAPARVAAS